VLFLLYIFAPGILHRTDWKLELRSIVRQITGVIRDATERAGPPAEQETLPHGYFSIIRQGPLDIRIAGARRRVALNAGQTWIVDRGQKLLYVTVDRKGQRLNLYDPGREVSKAILTTDQAIDGIIELPGDPPILAVRLHDAKRRVPAVIVLRKEGPILRLPGADILKWDGGTLTVGYYTAAEWEDFAQKPHKIERLSIIPPGERELM
jgi:hypothetical protein